MAYLRAMMSFNRIGAQVWHNTYTANSAETWPNKDALGFLHYLITQWYNDLPDNLKLKQPDMRVPPDRGLQRLRLLLHLRSNQIQILLYQPALYSIQRFRKYPGHVVLLVNTAKDMIQKLDELNRTTTIYQTQQTYFNHFLISALGVIFLAVTLNPTEFAGQVRQEFHLALDLVRRLGTKSAVSKRMWKMIRGLRKLGGSLGHTNSQDSSGDDNDHGGDRGLDFSHQANVGLFGSDADALGPIDPWSGLQMTKELSDLFRAIDNDRDASFFDTFSVNVSGGTASVEPGSNPHPEARFQCDFSDLLVDLWTEVLP